MNTTARIGTTIAKALASVLSIFNFFAGIVSLIGFIVIRDWLVIGLGLLMMYAMPKVYSFVNVPHLGLIALAIAALERGRTVLGFILDLAGALYSNTMVAGWIWIAFIRRTRPPCGCC
jgi:hypothetical protein